MKVARVSAGIGLLAIMAVLSSGSLSGQETKAGNGQLPGYWDKLALTDAQRDEIVKLNSEYKSKADKLEDELRRLRAELARKRVAVLTDEQRKKLVDLVAADAIKEKAIEQQKGAPEKERPKGKEPDKR